MTQKEAELVESLRNKASARMNEREVEFLRDVAGFIDFAIRGGLTFPTTVLSIVGDLNEIVRTGCDYERARALGLKPKVEGFSKITDDDFEGTEDDE